MATKSVYLPDPTIDDGLLRVSGDEHHHLKVSRTQPGELIDVFDGEGRVWAGEVDSVDKKETRIRVVTARSESGRQVELVLAQALIKPASFEWILEKAVELGVTRIIPFRAERSNAARGRIERWRRIIVEAAKQSKHYRLPHLDEVTDLDSVLAFRAASKILFAEKDGISLKSAVSGGPVLYLIGPEGGWTDDERSRARATGVAEVQLGSHVMRSETAAVVATALIQYELGVF